MVINDFVTAMQGKDHKGLAACFTEDCRLVDYCPSMVKRQNTFLYGRNAIEMSFHNKFMFGGFTMRDPRIVNERTVSTDHAWWRPEAPCELDEGLYDLWDLTVENLLPYDCGTSGFGANYKNTICKIYRVAEGE